jgi:tetratricopeptide (TPR) repeat protein
MDRRHLIILSGLMLTPAAWGQFAPIGVTGTVVLDEDASQEIRREVLMHLDEWAIFTEMKPGRDPRGHPWVGVQFPAVAVDVRMNCDGRSFGTTTASTEMHLILYLRPGSTDDKKRGKSEHAKGTFDVIKTGEKKNAEGSFNFLVEGADRPMPNGMHSLTTNGVAGCTVTAFLPGFRSETAVVPQHQLVGTAKYSRLTPLVLHRTEGSTGALLSPTFWSAPLEARNLVKNATEPGKNDLAAATASLKRAVALDPRYAEAWTQLAEAEEMTEPDAAPASYQRAMAADPAYIFPYQKLLRLETQQAEWEEAAATATKLLKICPHADAEAWYDLAFAAKELKRAAEAEQSARRGIADDPDHTMPELERLLGRILSDKGDTAGASEHFRNYLHWCADAPDAAFVAREISLLGGPAAAATTGEKGKPVGDLVASLRRALQSGTADERIAESLRDYQLAERLDDRTVEALESEGAGARTVGELRRLGAESVQHPLPAAAPIESPARPSREEQERAWVEAGGNAARYIGSLPNFICTQEVRRYVESAEQPYDTLRVKLTYVNQKED